MAGTKRSAPDSSDRTTRSSKAAKTGEKSSPNKTSPKAKGKRGPKAPTNSAFKAKALPLHVNFTHTPPAITDDDKETSTATADPGFIGNVTLLPSNFSTGSYGWKGSKRIAIELQNGDEKEKVHVMISINATVVNSKQAGKDEEAAENGDAKEDNEADADGEEAEASKDDTKDE